MVDDGGHDGGHDDGGWNDDGGDWDDDWEDFNFCNQFEAEECEMMPFCELTEEGCILSENGFDDGGHDGGHDDGGWNDDGGDWDDDWEDFNFCNQFEAEECEMMPFCELTEEGCILSENGFDDGGWNDDGGDWDDDWEDFNFCNQFEAEECEMMPFCELTEEGCILSENGFDDGGHDGGHDDGGWNDDGGDWDDDWDDHFIECEDFDGDECDEIPFCEWTDAGCLESEYGWCDDDENDWGDGHDGMWDFDFSFCYELDAEACDIVPFCSWDIAENICGINQWGWGDSNNGFSFGNGDWNWNEGGFDLGDINVDSQINVVDIVKQVNFILEEELPNDFEKWASDLNIDELINVVDVVNLVSTILNARIDYGHSTATLKGSNLITDGSIGAIQFDGKLLSTLNGADNVYTKNGKTVIINILGSLETSRFELSDDSKNIMVVASSGDEVSISTIEEFSLLANYPNPFNPSTTISYGVDMDAIVNVSIYNVYGQLVETLVNEYKNAGIHTMVWNAENHANGMYILKLNSPYTSEVKKITLLK